MNQASNLSIKSGNIGNIGNNRLIMGLFSCYSSLFYLPVRIGEIARIASMRFQYHCEANKLIFLIFPISHPQNLNRAVRAFMESFAHSFRLGSQAL